MPPLIPHQTIDGIELKRCSECTEWKPLDQYTKEKRRADGLFYMCKSCLRNMRHERREKDKEYRRNNRDKVNEWRRNERQRNKENQTDVHIRTRIKENLARRMRFLLNGQQKSANTCDIIGCSPEELKVHIEKTFEDGMTWDNYGDWHIDHIIPCAAFDHSDDTELRACWNFRNLRAMWGIENIVKSSTFDEGDKDMYMSAFKNSETNVL